MCQSWCVQSVDLTQWSTLVLISFVQFGSTVSVALDPMVIIPCAPTHTHELLRIFVPSHT